MRRITALTAFALAATLACSTDITAPSAATTTTVAEAGVSTAFQPVLAASTEICPSETPVLNPIATPAWFAAHFEEGPAIPSTRKDFVPQGLGYWAAKDWLITSLYTDCGTNRIAITRRSGAFVKFLVPVGSDGVALVGHMGGLSVSINNLWISTTSVQGNKVVYRFPLSAVAAAPTSGSIRANGVWNVGNVSYSTFYSTGTGKDYLYFGTFDAADEGTSTMVRYLLSSKEDIVAGSATTITTPTQVQGVTVADGNYIFSTSYGRQNYSRLKFKNISTGFISNSYILLPPMSEGIVRVPLGRAGWADDVLYVNFESGANMYADAALRTFNFHYALITDLIQRGT